MLILTRKIGESIIINDNIEIKLIKNKYGQIALGIDAPHNVIVHRKEIQERINSQQNENENKSKARPMIKKYKVVAY